MELKNKTMNIYVVILVTYDHYQFNENKYASLYIEECFEYIKKQDIKEYSLKKPEEIESEQFLKYGYTSHYWIQTL